MKVTVMSPTAKIIYEDGRDLPSTRSTKELMEILTESIKEISEEDTPEGAFSFHVSTHEQRGTEEFQADSDE